MSKNKQKNKRRKQESNADIQGTCTAYFEYLKRNWDPEQFRQQKNFLRTIPEQFTQETPSAGTAGRNPAELIRIRREKNGNGCSCCRTISRLMKNRNRHEEKHD